MISTSSSDVAGWVLATGLQALSDCGRAPISTSYVGSGEIAWDDCCGTLVAVPERIYRSEQFPIESTGEVICFDGFIAISVNLILLRCVPVVDDRGRPPSESALALAHQDLLGDAAVLYNALTGAFPDDWERTNPAQTFLGAQGGCIGVETRIIIGLEQAQFGICCTNPVPHEPGDPICLIHASSVRFDPCEGLTSTNVQDAICELASSGGVPGPPGPEGPPGPQGPPGPPGPPTPVDDPIFFSAISSLDQITTTGTPTEMNFPTVLESSEVSLVGTSRFTVSRAALIDIQFSAQVHHRGGGGSGETLHIWLAVDGVPVPDSASRLIVPNSRYQVPAWNFFLRVNPGEEVALMWQTDNANIVLEHLDPSGSIPAVPSLILTVDEIK